MDSPSHSSAGRLGRFMPSLIGLAVLSAMVCVWFAAPETYMCLLFLWGIEPYRFPFLDAAGSLAAWECARLGVDVILADPCDLLHRGYNYAPFWMTIDWIPLDQQDRVPVGLALAALFLASLSALPPPCTRGELCGRSLAICSTMVVFAIERCNPDLLIFVLVILMLALLRRAPSLRPAGYAFGFLAGAIKYYPFILLALVLRENRRLGWPIALAGGAALLLFARIYWTQIVEGLPHITQGSPFGDLFGFKNVPLFAAFVAAAAGGSDGAIARAEILWPLVPTILVGWVIVRSGLFAQMPVAIAALDDATRLPLLAGALLLVGCFFTGQSIGYRGVFLLLLLPGMAAFARSAARPVALAGRIGGIGIPLLMWAEAIRHGIHVASTGDTRPLGDASLLFHQWDCAAWLARETGWWLLIGLLLSVLAGFAATRCPPGLLRLGGRNAPMGQRARPA